VEFRAETALDRFLVRFGRRHAVLPVVHVTGTEQALCNVEVARAAGADGAFLISHGRELGHQRLFELHGQLTRRVPGFWLGVNCLDLDAVSALTRVGASSWTADGRWQANPAFHPGAQGLGGVWCDDAGVRDDVVAQPEAARAWAAKQAHGVSALYFGGVDFKHQRPAHDPAEAARLGARYMDVVTTSGSATGAAPAVAKIRAMKRALPDTPLAIASGITPENVLDFLPWADAFLVATGISSSFDELDPVRTRALIERVRPGLGDHPLAAVVQPWSDLEEAAANDLGYFGPRPPTVFPSFREVASRLSYWSHVGDVLLRELGARELGVGVAWDAVLNAAGLRAELRYTAAVYTSPMPIEDGFLRCLRLAPVREGAAGTAVLAGATLETFVRHELERGDVIEQVITAHYGRHPGSERQQDPRFERIDYPGFDTGTLVQGFALLVQAGQIWLWSRPVHLHK